MNCRRLSVYCRCVGCIIERPYGRSDRHIDLLNVRHSLAALDFYVNFCCCEIDLFFVYLYAPDPQRYSSKGSPLVHLFFSVVVSLTFHDFPE